MSFAGILIGVLDCILVAAILILVGAIIVMVAKWMNFAIDWNVQRIYMGIVLLIFIICVISLLVGAPMVHVFR